METDIKALVVAPTYGRIPLLNRLLASFLRQSYSNKHMVIVNDDPNVTLHCDYNNVTIVNLSEKTIVPIKRNIGISSGAGNIIFPHDDDDIFLPNRLQNHMDEYQKSDISSYRNSASYTIYGSIFKRSNGAPPTDISYTRQKWESVGGYQAPTSVAEDTEFYNSLNDVCVKHNPEKADFVYNWSGVNYHASSTTEEQRIELAYKQLQDLGLLNKIYTICPDFEEYDKFVQMSELVDKNNGKIQVSHLELGKLQFNI